MQRVMEGKIFIKIHLVQHLCHISVTFFVQVLSQDTAVPWLTQATLTTRHFKPTLHTDMSSRPHLSSCLAEKAQTAQS